MTESLNCPLLGLFGAEDSSPSPEQVAQIEQELLRHGKIYDFQVYDDAGHCFFADYRPSYNHEAAVDGWERVFSWFTKNLL
jgi:carboxymethylenebutenolidase